AASEAVVFYTHRLTGEAVANINRVGHYTNRACVVPVSLAALESRAFKSLRSLSSSTVYSASTVRSGYSNWNSPSSACVTLAWSAFRAVCISIDRTPYFDRSSFNTVFFAIASKSVVHFDQDCPYPFE